MNANSSPPPAPPKNRKARRQAAARARRKRKVSARATSDTRAVSLLEERHPPLPAERDAAV